MFDSANKPNSKPMAAYEPPSEPGLNTILEDSSFSVQKDLNELKEHKETDYGQVSTSKGRRSTQERSTPQDQIQNLKQIDMDYEKSQNAGMVANSENAEGNRTPSIDAHSQVSDGVRGSF